MQVSSLSVTYPLNRKYNSTINTKSTGNPAFKSLLYNPDSIIHRINPVLRFVDDCYRKSVIASKITWHEPIPELEPWLKVIDIEDKKHPHVRMWDINNNNKTKYAIVLHGLSHNITSLQDMYKKILSDTKYAVLAPEYHGLTPDNTDKVYLEPKKILRDMQNAITYLNNKGIKNENITLIGHSFGGFAAATLAKANPDLENVILVSSTNKYEHLSRRVQLNPKKVSSLVVNALTNNSWLTFPLKLAFNTGRILRCVESPIDIIHSNSDKSTTLKNSIEMAHNCKNLRSMIFLEGYHSMDDNKIAAVVSILKQNCNVTL